MIPDVSSDRIWYIKTTSFYSIQNISAYINLQKQLNNSLIGNYKLFLKPKENLVNGKVFTNFVLDIVKSDDFISNQVSNQENTIIENTNSTSKSKKNIPQKNSSTPLLHLLIPLSSIIQIKLLILTFLKVKRMIQAIMT